MTYGEIISDKPELGKAEVTDHAPLYVSLYIVILAFFILLNTMSTYEIEKTKLVVQSVKKTFAYDKPKETIDSNPVSEPSGKATETFMRSIEEYARRFIPVEYLNLERNGDVIEVKIPASLLFTGNTAIVDPGNSQLLKEFAGAVELASYSLDVSLELILDVKPASVLGVMYDTPDKTEIRQAGALARFFIQQGVKNHQIITGLHQSDNALVSMRFGVAPLPEKEGK